MSARDRLLEHLDEHCDVLVLDDLARDDWLAAREHGVGASDAAVCLGVSPWSSPYQRWAERTGVVERRPATTGMEFGLFVEPFVFSLHERVTGRPAVPAGVLAVSREHPFMLCTPDAATVDGSELGLIEAKTVGSREARRWGPDTAPVEYVAQAMHQLIVTRVDFVDLVPFMLDDRVLGDIVRVRYDDTIARELIAREAEWWTHVTMNTPPPTDGTVHTERALLDRWPTHDAGTVRELTDEERRSWLCAQSLRQEIADLEAICRG